MSPNIAFESGQFSSILGMVAAGMGLSLVPEMAIDRHAGCRYIRLIVLASVRGRSFNRVQQALAAGFKRGTKSKDEV